MHLQKEGFEVGKMPCIIVPDYGKLFKLEKKRHYINKRREILQQNPPLLKCFAKKYYFDDEAYRQKMDKLDFKIDRELAREIKASRSAFVAMESLEMIHSLKKSLAYTLPYFRANSFSKVMAGLGEGLDDMVNLKNSQESLGYFDKHKIDKKYQLRCKPFVHPSDIQWEHIQGKVSKVAWKRVGVIFVSILILIFLTSPAAILTPFETYLKLDWIGKQGIIGQFIFQTIIPSLIILGINELLILIIETLGRLWVIIVEWESHHRFSQEQKSILQKCFVYFLFNMLLVPGFSTLALKSFYDVFTINYRGGLYFLQNLFHISSGEFFLILVIQTGGGGFLAQFNAIAFLFKNYISPTVAIKSQQYLIRNENWRKDNGTVYPYGLFYAQAAVMTSIGLVFQ